jgi:thioester reductase-like protein
MTRQFISPHADSLLSAEIFPTGEPATTNMVFLTGATGFLGAQVLAELLLNRDWQIICLVRANDDMQAAKRIMAALKTTGRNYASAISRIIPLRGDLSKPNFGFNTTDFDALSFRVGQIIHCAAEVSWIKPYSRLRGSHLVGTLNCIRLACRGTVKPLHFVSTLAVCYVPNGPKKVDELTDMSAYLEQIPLGYAQAKCVAESLLRQAAERGLPVTILRCGLICGDSLRGASNHEDFISRMLRGAVDSGISADVDWGLDCVPVDTVAKALCVLAQNESASLRVLHLHHDEPRQWREMVLWLCLNKYQVALVSLEQWLEMVGDSRSERAPDLHVLRPFFLARPPLMDGRSLTELYLESGRQRICSAASHAYFATKGLWIPRLNAHLLNHYLVSYQEQGFLPKQRITSVSRNSLDLQHIVENGMRIALSSPELTLTKFTATALSGSSILSELNTVSSGGLTGLWHCKFNFQRTANSAIVQLQAVLKLRATHSEQDATTLAVANLCSPKLGAAFSNHLPLMAYRGGLAREIAIATSNDKRLTDFMPQSLAVMPSDDEHGGFLEEYLDNVDLIDSANTTENWRTEHIEAAVQALGNIHSVWYRREAELLRQSWFTPDANNALAMLPLWLELAEFSSARFSLDLGVGIRKLQLGIIDDLDNWWPQWLAMPRTLIHNDFNSRNLAFRRSPQGLTLCAYDWELASIGLPQYDLAELLCFVLPATSNPQHWIDLHRSSLESASGIAIDSSEWQAGFLLALRHYMMIRLPQYAMIDRFKPQNYLSKLLTNWYRIYRWTGEEVQDQK